MVRGSDGIRKGGRESGKVGAIVPGHRQKVGSTLHRVFSLE